MRPYLAALLIIAAFFAVAETVRPYYFFQDDNRDIFLPFYVHNYRAALDGQLAQFNFFQSLGKPHFASGQVAAFSPVPYVAIFLSSAIFGHFFASVDILVLIYLLIGAAGMVFLGRRLGFSNAASVFAAVSWTITPFNMLTSQSWTTFPPVIGLMPWILAGALLIYRQRTVSGGWIFVVSHLALIYVGAPQFVLYAGFVEAGVILLLAIFDWRAGTLPKEHAIRAFVVYALLTALIAGLSMPLLLPMWRHVELSAFRGGAMSDAQLRSCSISPTQLLNGLFVPFKRFYLPIGWEWCGTSFPGSYPHQGYLVTLLLLGYGWLRKKIDAEQRRFADASFIVAVVLLIAAMGLLTPYVKYVPVANRFRWPFKYYGFANLLAVLCAAAAFDALRMTRNRAIASIAVLVQTVNLAALDLSFPTQAFMEHLDPVPLTEPLRDRLAGSRYLSVGWEGGPQKHTIASGAFDYATLWELHYFGGYDPLVPWRNLHLTLGLDYIAIFTDKPARLPVDYLRHWGVRYYILNQPWAPGYESHLAAQGFRRVYADPRRVLMEDPRPNPLIGSRECTMRSLDRIGDDLRAVVDCKANSTLRMRFLYFPDFSATLDGQPAPIQSTVSGQILMPVPAGVHEIRLMYDDPRLEAGLWIALATACAGAVVAMLLRERRRKRGGIV